MTAFKPGPDLLAGPFARTSLGPKTKDVELETKLPPPKAPRGLRIEDRIGVQAPAEVIWEIVHDLSSWAAWNPTYTAAAGEIRIGETLVLTLALPGQPPQEIRPKVLEWVPEDPIGDRSSNWRRPLRC